MTPPVAAPAEPEARVEAPAPAAPPVPFTDATAALWRRLARPFEVTVVAEVANVPVVGMADSGELTAGEDLHAVGVDDVAGGEVLVVAEFAGAEVWQGKEITGG